MDSRWRFGAVLKHVAPSAVLYSPAILAITVVGNKDLNQPATEREEDLHRNVVARSAGADGLDSGVRQTKGSKSYHIVCVSASGNDSLQSRSTCPASSYAPLTNTDAS